jgi:hypothetical protein
VPTINPSTGPGDSADHRDQEDATMPETEREADLFEAERRLQRIVSW